jgi:hypothetical protein
MCDKLYLFDKFYLFDVFIFTPFVEVVEGC